ncbi:MAG: heme ABC transporter ATP-binding protein [Anaerolineales bacterium]|jgi:iron complex transport system ATP-binding protein|nr:heme ABC transporter ATP-binding protein [Anaerolineales bacterium]
MLSTKNLAVAYHGQPVIKNISFGIEKGEILALVGPNGSGKSTLIRALSGILPASRGTVSLFGRPMSGLNPIERARQIAVVPQGVQLPPAFSVIETVLFGRTPYLNFLGQLSARDKRIARDSLARVDALSLAERRVGELSGGEQQRVLLARALAQSTPILLLDEPTSHLDLHHQMTLMQLVRGLVREGGLTVLIALHDLNLAARYADRIALLENGELKAVGKPADILTQDTLSRVYGWPVQVIPHPFHGTPLVLPQ